MATTTNSKPTLGDWLAEAPFTLALSSGFFGFFAHAGMLARLTAEGLRPSKLAGSSAGALVAGCYAAGLEPSDLAQELFVLRRRDFWDPAPGFGLLRGAKFEARLRSVVGSSTIEKARVPLAVSVFDIWSRRTSVLRDGDLCSAIRASCSLPPMFQPVRRSGRLLLDGGIADRPGLAGVADAEHVLYHHLLPTRSWRRRRPEAVTIPARSGLRAIAIEALPRVGPSALENGRAAFERAFEMTAQALTMPAPADGSVHRI